MSTTPRNAASLQLGRSSISQSPRSSSNSRKRPTPAPKMEKILHSSGGHFVEGEVQGSSPSASASNEPMTRAESVEGTILNNIDRRRNLNALEKRYSARTGKTTRRPSRVKKKKDKAKNDVNVNERTSTGTNVQVPSPSSQKTINVNVVERERGEKHHFQLQLESQSQPQSTHLQPPEAPQPQHPSTYSMIPPEFYKSTPKVIEELFWSGPLQQFEFPSKKPNSRSEVIYLRSVLNSLLKRIQTNYKARTRAVVGHGGRIRVREGAREQESEESGTGIATTPTPHTDDSGGENEIAANEAIDSLMEAIREERDVYSVVMHEVTRQVSTECQERGDLLAQLRSVVLGILQKAAVAPQKSRTKQLLSDFKTKNPSGRRGSMPGRINHRGDRERDRDREREKGSPRRMSIMGSPSNFSIVSELGEGGSRSGRTRRRNSVASFHSRSSVGSDSDYDEPGVYSEMNYAVRSHLDAATTALNATKMAINTAQEAELERLNNTVVLLSEEIFSLRSAFGLRCQRLVKSVDDAMSRVHKWGDVAVEVAGGLHGVWAKEALINLRAIESEWDESVTQIQKSIKTLHNGTIDVLYSHIAQWCQLLLTTLPDPVLSSEEGGEYIGSGVFAHKDVYVGNEGLQSTRRLATAFIAKHKRDDSDMLYVEEEWEKEWKREKKGKGAENANPAPHTHSLIKEKEKGKGKDKIATHPHSHSSILPEPLRLKNEEWIEQWREFGNSVSRLLGGVSKLDFADNELENDADVGIGNLVNECDVLGDKVEQWVMQGTRLHVDRDAFELAMQGTGLKEKEKENREKFKEIDQLALAGSSILISLEKWVEAVTGSFLLARAKADEEHALLRQELISLAVELTLIAPSPANMNEKRINRLRPSVSLSDTSVYPSDDLEINTDGETSGYLRSQQFVYEKENWDKTYSDLQRRLVTIYDWHSHLVDIVRGEPSNDMFETEDDVNQVEVDGVVTIRDADIDLDTLSSQAELPTAATTTATDTHTPPHSPSSPPLPTQENLNVNVNVNVNASKGKSRSGVTFSMTDVNGPTSTLNSTSNTVFDDFAHIDHEYDVDDAQLEKSIERDLLRSRVKDIRKKKLEQLNHYRKGDVDDWGIETRKEFIDFDEDLPTITHIEYESNTSTSTPSHNITLRINQEVGKCVVLLDTWVSESVDLLVQMRKRAFKHAKQLPELSDLQYDLLEHRDIIAAKWRVGLYSDLEQSRSQNQGQTLNRSTSEAHAHKTKRSKKIHSVLLAQRSTKTVSARGRGAEVFSMDHTGYGVHGDGSITIGSGSGVKEGGVGIDCGYHAEAGQVWVSGTIQVDDDDDQFILKSAPGVLNRGFYSHDSQITVCCGLACKAEVKLVRKRDKPSEDVSSTTLSANRGYEFDYGAKHALDEYGKGRGSGGGETNVKGKAGDSDLMDDTEIDDEWAADFWSDIDMVVYRAPELQNEEVENDSDSESESVEDLVLLDAVGEKYVITHDDILHKGTQTKLPRDYGSGDDPTTDDSSDWSTDTDTDTESLTSETRGSSKILRTEKGEEGVEGEERERGEEEEEEEKEDVEYRKYSQMVPWWREGEEARRKRRRRRAKRRKRRENALLYGHGEGEGEGEERGGKKERKKLKNIGFLFKKLAMLLSKVVEAESDENENENQAENENSGENGALIVAENSQGRREREGESSERSENVKLLAKIKTILSLMEHHGGSLQLSRSTLVEGGGDGDMAIFGVGDNANLLPIRSLLMGNSVFDGTSQNTTQPGTQQTTMESDLATDMDMDIEADLSDHMKLQDWSPDSALSSRAMTLNTRDTKLSVLLGVAVDSSMGVEDGGSGSGKKKRKGKGKDGPGVSLGGGKLAKAKRKMLSKREPKGKAWVVKLIRDILDAKAILDFGSDGNSVAHPLQRKGLPDYILDYLTNKHGLRALVERTGWDLLTGCTRLRNEDEEIEVFSRFLEESMPKDELTVYTHARFAALEWSIYGSRFPSDISSTLPIYICLVRANEAARTTMEFYGAEAGKINRIQRDLLRLSMSKKAMSEGQGSMSSTAALAKLQTHGGYAQGDGVEKDKKEKGSLRSDRVIPLTHFCALLLKEYREVRRVSRMKLSGRFNHFLQEQASHENYSSGDDSRPSTSSSIQVSKHLRLNGFARLFNSLGLALSNEEIRTLYMKLYREARMSRKVVEGEGVSPQEGIDLVSFMTAISRTGALPVEITLAGEVKKANRNAEKENAAARLNAVVLIETVSSKWDEIKDFVRDLEIYASQAGGHADMQRAQICTNLLTDLTNFMSFDVNNMTASTVRSGLYSYRGLLNHLYMAQAERRYDDSLPEPPEAEPDPDALRYELSLLTSCVLGDVTNQGEGEGEGVEGEGEGEGDEGEGDEGEEGEEGEGEVSHDILMIDRGQNGEEREGEEVEREDEDEDEETQLHLHTTVAFDLDSSPAAAAAARVDVEVECMYDERVSSHE